MKISKRLFSLMMVTATDGKGKKPGKQENRKTGATDAAPV